MRRAKAVRRGGRWAHKVSGRVAVVTGIVYPHVVEYKYEPTARRTRRSYLSFLLNFSPARAA